MSTERYFGLALFLFITLWMLLGKSCTDTKRQYIIDTTRSLLDKNIDSVKYYKDIYGKEHAKNEKLILDKEYLSEELSQVSSELDIKKKQIQSITSITSTSKGNVIIHDTATEYRDSFIYIAKKGDTIYFELKDTLQIVDYWKRTWFLGKKKYYVDVSSTNPYMTINKIAAREIKIKTPRVILGPSLNYNFLHKTITPGISILYYPLTIKL